MFRTITIIATILVLVCACGSGQDEPQNASSKSTSAIGKTQSQQSIDEVLEQIPAADKARIKYRHPKETLMLFGVEPGMTVVDTTPGSTWYAGILANYLGPNGKIIGADRPLAVWEWFGPEYAPPEFIKDRVNWPNTWPNEQTALHGSAAPAFDAIVYGSVPVKMKASADVVLIMRELHNWIATDQSGALVSQVLREIRMMLKPDGVLGIVQHRAPESTSDSWANGENGYIKQSAVISLVESIGFELVQTSEINANAKDKPSEDDHVWRLPPAYDLPENGSVTKEQMTKIGESDRMTLKFKKRSN